jgi:antirestriction protein
MSEHDNEPSPEQGREHEALHPRIWIGSLADYNAGRLHGDWVDAAVEQEELVDAAQRILATSREPGAEEWGIFDYDEFGVYRVNEYDDLGSVAAVARGITRHGAAFAAWAELHDGDEAMLDQFEDAFLGTYESREAFVDSLLDDLGLSEQLAAVVPDWLVPYVQVDRNGIAHDLQLSGDVHFEDGPDGTVWAFDARL